ncbi:hypothetical protein APHNP_0520 [Anaplasma phagocytophilum str. ApNP]|uniref:Uncharacterized protein n=1 Tax=Anaplasma phagocytophilum str. ApNP TaxID=1359153 RepID=A0A0F3NIN7_ANAPH|nr:hypothetical protein APHNP_0520 [Anaplasma phagocytophilum str. ApNP]
MSSFLLTKLVDTLPLNDHTFPPGRRYYAVMAAVRVAVLRGLFFVFV